MLFGLGFNSFDKRRQFGRQTLGIRFIWCDCGNYASVHVSCNKDLRILGEQLAKLFIELDELLLCWGLFICDHASSIGAQKNDAIKKNKKVQKISHLIVNSA